MNIIYQILFYCALKKAPRDKCCYHPHKWIEKSSVHSCVCVCVCLFAMIYYSQNDTAWNLNAVEKKIQVSQYFSIPWILLFETQ